MYSAIDHGEAWGGSCAPSCKDPRADAHHRVVAHLFTETCFLDEIRRFAAGTPRDHLQPEVLQTMATWRFIPIAESSIESRHARTSIAWRRHWISPVRVSLSNRLGVLERGLRSGHIDVRDLLTSLFLDAPEGLSSCIIPM